MDINWLREQERSYLDLQIQMQNPNFFQSEDSQESL